MTQTEQSAGRSPTFEPPPNGILNRFFGRRPVRAELRRQSEDDDTRTRQTVTLMAAYAIADARSPIVRRAALEAIAGLPARDQRKEAERVWHWVRRRVRFIEDRELATGLEGIEPDGAEVLVRPVDLLTMPTPVGDCDDFAMLTAAMLRALGIPWAFRTVAAEPGHPQTYSHVYVVALLPEGELPLDTSHGPRPGWEVPAAGKSKTWRPDAMGTLGSIDWGAMLQHGVTATTDILKARYAHPPAGTFEQSPEGVYYRQPQNAPPYTFPGGGFGLPQSNLTTLALIAGAAILMILVARK